MATVSNGVITFTEAEVAEIVAAGAEVKGLVDEVSALARGRSCREALINATFAKMAEAAVVVGEKITGERV